MAYRIQSHGVNYFFTTKEEAISYANELFRIYGVIVGIEHKEPAFS